MLGERYKELRENRKLTQEELAKELGDLSPSTISMCEKSSKHLSIYMLIKYADYFQVSTDYLLGRTNIKSHRHTSHAIEKLLGLNAEAIQILIDPKGERKAKEAKRKEKEYLDTLPKRENNSMSIDEDIASCEKRAELLNDYNDYEEARNNRIEFLDALITDDNFQNLCDSFAMGYSQLWWAYMAKHPEAYDKINVNTPLEIRGMNMKDIAASMRGRITAEGEATAKAYLYDCMQYFSAFLHAYISELDK